MTPAQVALVQRSFAEIEHTAAEFSQAFYARLFRLDASLRVLFQGDSAAQGVRLMQMFKLAVSSLDRVDELAPTLRALGLRHQGYGVRRYDFDTLAQALKDCLRARFGEAFDAALDEAWGAAYALIATEMRRGMGDSDTESQGWAPRRTVVDLEI